MIIKKGEEIRLSAKASLCICMSVFIFSPSDNFLSIYYTRIAFHRYRIYCDFFILMFPYKQVNRISVDEKNQAPAHYIMFLWFLDLVWQIWERQAGSANWQCQAGFWWLQDQVSGWISGPLLFVISSPDSPLLFSLLSTRVLIKISPTYFPKILTPSFSLFPFGERHFHPKSQLHPTVHLWITWSPTAHKTQLWECGKCIHPGSLEVYKLLSL